VLSISIAIFLSFKKNNLRNMIGRSFLTVSLLYGFLNFHLYPAILKYQAGSEAAFYINSLATNEAVFQYNEESYAFTFYLQPVLSYWANAPQKRNKQPYLIYTKKDNLRQFSKQGIKTTILKEFPDFHISLLSGSFINYNTRASVLKQFVVARITP
jgi:hypothetical protein